MDALFCEECIDPEWLPLYYLVEAARQAQKKMKKSSRFSRTRKVEKKIYDSSSSGFLELKWSMKKKRTSIINNGRNTILKRKRQTKKENGGKNRATVAVLPNPPTPLLPENIKQHIVEKMGGSDWGLVIQKKLFFTDVNPSASHFSIPFSKLENHEFLTESEAEHLKNGKESITVCLLEPSMVETEVNFKRWEMNKSEMYVIKKPWNNVVKNNGLKEGDVVQLWSFRVNSAMCFALLKLPESS